MKLTRLRRPTSLTASRTPGIRRLTLAGGVLALLLLAGGGVQVVPALADPGGPAVAISGTAQSRETLTAIPSNWPGDTSGGFSYQWQRCNPQGSNCTPISGATNATYTAQDGDIGSTLVVEASANSTVASSPATTVVRYPAPYGGTCSLVPNYGDADSTVFTVTCENWSDYTQQTPLTYSVQTWGCDDEGGCALESTTTPTTVPRAEFVISGFNHVPGGGADRVVMIICQHNGGCTEWTDTAYVADGGSPHINPASPPTINGDAWLGETLSADPGEWSGNPTFGYQWLRCAFAWPHEWWYPWDQYADCAPIDGETGVNYTVQPSDYGSIIMLEVSATNAIGTRAVPSAATSYVVHAPPTNTAPPTVSGSAQVGQTLTADPGVWTQDVLGYHYQWYRCSDNVCDLPVDGATEQDYELTEADAGHQLAVEVRAESSDQTSDPAMSTPTATVASANAELSNLTLSAGTLSPDFDAATDSYTVGVPYTTTSLDLTPTVSEEHAAVTVNGSPAASGSPVTRSLNVGANTITVEVTAEDGTTTHSYTVMVTRAAASTNADLSDLTLSAGALSPDFDTATDSYTVSVPNSVSSLDLTPTVSESHATVTVNGNAAPSGSPVTRSLNVGANTITIVVTAQDGQATETYTVTVTRAAAPLPPPPPVAPPPPPPPPPPPAADTTPPTRPFNPVGKVSNRSLIKISFGASSDNIGVSGYELVRKGVVLRTSATPAFTVPVSILLRPSKLVLEIRAFDSAGNKSGAVTVTLTRKAAPNHPRVIPGWAWKLDAWESRAPATRGKRPVTPKRLPGWYAKWAAWHRQPVTVSP